MNASIEPKLVEGGVFAILASAQSLIEAQDFPSAIQLYTQLLSGDLSPAQRGEVLTNMGAALCLSARGNRDQAAVERLNQARETLRAAFQFRPRQATPVAWATTRANLAVVYLTRFDATGANDDLLSAHMALDGVDDALRGIEDKSLLDWVSVIRDHLVELRERRTTGR